MRGKAEQFGVKEIYIDDLREEFVRDYVFPMFRCADCVHMPFIRAIRSQCERRRAARASAHR